MQTLLRNLCKLLQFLFKIRYVLEIAVDRSESDVRNPVGVFEYVHDQITDRTTVDLRFSHADQLLFDFSNQVVNRLLADRPFFTRLHQVASQFAPIKGFAPLIFLDDEQIQHFRPFVRGKPLFTSEAFSPSAGDTSAVGLTLIKDFCLKTPTVRAFHNSPVSCVKCAILYYMYRIG